METVFQKIQFLFRQRMAQSELQKLRANIIQSV